MRVDARGCVLPVELAAYAIFAEACSVTRIDPGGDTGFTVCAPTLLLSLTLGVLVGRRTSLLFVLAQSRPFSLAVSLPVGSFPFSATLRFCGLVLGLLLGIGPSFLFGLGGSTSRLFLAEPRFISLSLGFSLSSGAGFLFGTARLFGLGSASRLFLAEPRFFGLALGFVSRATGLLGGVAPAFSFGGAACIFPQLALRFLRSSHVVCLCRQVVVVPAPRRAEPGTKGLRNGSKDRPHPKSPS